MAIVTPGDIIKWSPAQGLGFDPLDAHEALWGNWVYADGTGLPPTATNAFGVYYGTPLGFASIAHPPLKSNFKQPTYHSNGDDTINLDLINELELKAYPRNHGREKWICMVSTAGFAASPYDTTITEYAANGTTVLGTYSITGPGQVAIDFEQGRLYSSDSTRPATFYTTFDHGAHVIAPTTLSGTSFTHYSSRYSETTFHIYAFDSATVEIFVNDASGIEGTPAYTVDLNNTDLVTYNTQVSDPTSTFIKSSGRIVVTAVENVPGGDSVRVPPASHYMCRQRSGPVLRLDNGGPAFSGTYFNHDPDVKLGSIVIGDGSGGDASMGLGIEHLSNTYYFEQMLSDFLVTSPFATEVKVYYWDTQPHTPGWVLGTTVDLTSSTLTNPQGDGRSGPDIATGYDDSGNASNFSFSGYTPNKWKFEAVHPFYIYVNDSLNNDEETLLGWCETRDSYAGAPWSNISDALDVIEGYYDDWLMCE
jgi:hypothetical protein